MKRLFVLGSLMVLAGCGVDGDPIRPSYNGTVSAGTDGVSAGVGTKIIRGNVSVHVGTSL
jgi:hypothetical protein